MRIFYALIILFFPFTKVWSDGKTVLTQQPANQSLQAAVAIDRANDVIIIDPKSRASDFKQAYDILKQDKTIGKISLQLRNGIILSNVVDINVMTSGTLILIKTNSPLGMKSSIVKIEDIDSIIQG